MNRILRQSAFSPICLAFLSQPLKKERKVGSRDRAAAQQREPLLKLHHELGLEMGLISLRCGFVTSSELFRGPHLGLHITGNSWSYPQRLWTCL